MLNLRAVEDPKICTFDQFYSVVLTVALLVPLVRQDILIHSDGSFHIYIALKCQI